MENALRWYNHIASFNDAEKQKYVDSTDVVHTRVPLCLDFKVRVKRSNSTDDRRVKTAKRNRSSNRSRSTQPRKPLLPLLTTTMSISSATRTKKRANKPNNVSLPTLRRNQPVNQSIVSLTFSLPSLLEPVLIAKSNIVLDVSLVLLIEWRDITFSTRRRSSHGTMKPT